MSLGAQWSPVGDVWYNVGLRLSGRVSYLCILLPLEGRAATIEYLPLVASGGMVNVVVLTSL